LSGADLREACLREAYLSGADLSQTCLDPTNPPNGLADNFVDHDASWKIGYRTRESKYIGSTIYEVGELYKAPVFSTCDTECHPGLYVFPTFQEAKREARYRSEVISVLFEAHNLHKAGSKYRVTEFLVWGGVE
jgi:hypothetical protein